MNETLTLPAILTIIEPLGRGEDGKSEVWTNKLTQAFPKTAEG
jgi:hypothetical protein